MVFWRITLAMVLLLLTGCNAFYFRHSHWLKQFPETDFPETRRTRALPNPNPETKFYYQARGLIDSFADQDILGFDEGGKNTPARQMIAKLFRGKAEDIAAVEAYLLKARPNRKPGTTSFANPNGDYDFTEIMLSYMLCFEPLAKHLSEKAKRHIAEVLIVEKGFKPKLKAPRMLGVIGETENHKLMREGSRHLKYQWLLHNSPPGTVDQNKWRKHADLVIEFAHEAVRTGGFEYNSRPYFGYTIAALMVIHDCTTVEALKTASAHALDRLLTGMAWAVYAGRFTGPFRRQLGRAYDKDLTKHAGIGLLTTFRKRQSGEALYLSQIPHGRHHALIAAMSSYQPSLDVFDALEKRGKGFVRLGHGRWSSPHTISYSNPSTDTGWLLSGGGSFQGKIKQVVPQPIVLLRRLGYENLDSVIHSPLPEDNLRVNNTGVFGPFAITDHAFVIPPNVKLLYREDYWQLFRITPDLHVMIYNHDDVHALYVLPVKEQAAFKHMQKVSGSNPALKAEGKLICHEGSQIFYNMKTSRKCWVITGYAPNSHRYYPEARKRVDWITTEFYDWPLEDMRELEVMDFK